MLVALPLLESDIRTAEIVAAQLNFKSMSKIFIVKNSDFFPEAIEEK